MVIVKLYGGLGNQMFQYAMARTVALRNGVQLELDLTWFSAPSTTTGRYFGLDKFNVQLCRASDTEIERCLALRKILGRDLYEAVIPFRFKKYIRTRDFQLFSEKYLKLRGDLYLEGYWTDERYFAEFPEIIKNEFTLSSELSGNNSMIASSMDVSESVSLHIRRGDYVTDSRFQTIFNICDENYYRRAVDLISERVTKPVFYIFSDDIEWVRENIHIGYDVVYVSEAGGCLPHEEIHLMGRCKHNIIANSTFSWWGAWLNSNEEKIVIAPEKWVNNSSGYGGQIVPLGWNRISIS